MPHAGPASGLGRRTQRPLGGAGPCGSPCSERLQKKQKEGKWDGVTFHGRGLKKLPSEFGGHKSQGQAMGY